jgi:hypothetical protein
MPTPVRPVVREILKNDGEQPVPDVIRKARAKGVIASDGALREAIYEIMGTLRKATPLSARGGPRDEGQGRARGPTGRNGRRSSGHERPA